MCGVCPYASTCTWSGNVGLEPVTYTHTALLPIAGITAEDSNRPIGNEWQWHMQRIKIACCTPPTPLLGLQASMLYRPPPPTQGQGQAGAHINQPKTSSICKQGGRKIRGVACSKHVAISNRLHFVDAELVDETVKGVVEVGEHQEDLNSRHGGGQSAEAHNVAKENDHMLVGVPNDLVTIL